jgi:hypothetical protein
MQVREACTAALKEKIRMANGADSMSHTVATKVERPCVTSQHFEIALTRVFPSVSNTVSTVSNPIAGFSRPCHPSEVSC